MMDAHPLIIVLAVWTVLNFVVAPFLPEAWTKWLGGLYVLYIVLLAIGAGIHTVNRS